MSAQYPRRDITEWNYEKGNLDEATKDYAVRAAKLVKELGGSARLIPIPGADHFFSGELGRLEESLYAALAE